MKTVKKKKKASMILPLLILVLLILAGSMGLSYLRDKLNIMERVHVRENDGSTDITASEGREDYLRDKNVLNIMLIGVDNDYLPGMNDRGNADGLMLVSINKKTKQITLTSFMRDMSLSYEPHLKNKVTLIYHDYGTGKLLKTLEDNFQIRIDNYLLVNYLNVIDIIDAMGGLELEITASEINGMNPKISNLNYLTGASSDTDLLSEADAGLCKLNGKQVAALLRIRNTGGNDQRRTNRARVIISAMKDKAKTMSIRELNAFADVVLKNITTDMETNQLIRLLLFSPLYMRYKLETERIPIEGAYTSDGSYIYIDLEKNTEALHNTIYGK